MPERAVAAWYASGVDHWPSNRVGRGDLPALLETYRMLGATEHVLGATAMAIRKVREPIFTVFPLLAMIADRKTIIDIPPPPMAMVGDVPLCCLDGFTRIGNPITTWSGFLGYRIGAIVTDDQVTVVAAPSNKSLAKFASKLEHLALAGATDEQVYRAIVAWGRSWDWTLANEHARSDFENAVLGTVFNSVSDRFEAAQEAIHQVLGPDTDALDECI